MNTAEYKKAYDRATEFVAPSRRPHVEGCIAEAIRLSEFWGADTGRAAMAALLHDITKSEGFDGQLKLLKKYGIIAGTVDKSAVKPLHAITGAAVARDMFCADGQVEAAIRWHTTGRAEMTLLEKVIYIADYIEPTRDFEGVEDVRALAYRDLDLALFTALRNTVIEVCSASRPLSPETVEAYNYYQQIINTAACRNKDNQSRGSERI